MESICGRDITALKTLIYAPDTSTTCQLWLTNDSSLHAEYQGHGILTYKKL